MKFAITGASGFVGRHLVARLLADGHDVLTVCRSAWRTEGAQAVRIADFAAAGAWGGVLDGIDVVVHLAARAHVLDDREPSPERAFERANVEAVVALAEAARAAGVRRIVHLSSIGVNGSRTRGRPFTEGDAPQPTELYAQSKWRAEQRLAEALAGSATEPVVLRPPLVYGPDCPGNFRLLLKLVQRLPVVPLGGLAQRRSFIHVGNLVDAIVAAALRPGLGGRTFVVADDEEITVGEVVRELNRGLGRGSWRVWPLPERLLALLAAAAGRGTAFDKLACELRVDGSAFRAAAGWRPPLAAAAALQRTAAQFRQVAGEGR